MNKEENDLIREIRYLIDDKKKGSIGEPDMSMKFADKLFQLGVDHNHESVSKEIYYLLLYYLLYVA